MKTETKAAAELIGDLAFNLERLDHLELFKLIQALMVLKMRPEIARHKRTRELLTVLVKVMTDWMSEPTPERTVDCYEHGVPLDPNGICPVSGVRGRRKVT
jgi:hypothetical protein